jgi:hypothetical protein
VRVSCPDPLCEKQFTSLFRSEAEAILKLDKKCITIKKFVMKPIIPRLAKYTTVFFFPLLLVLRWKRKSSILLFLGMIILAGCFRKFYSTGTVTQVDSAAIQNLETSNKYFIIHYKDSVLALSNISIDNNVIEGKIGPLPKYHSTQLTPAPNEAKPFKNAYSNAVLSEVHLYVNNNKSDTLAYPGVRVPLSDIYRMDVYEFDKKKTNLSTVMSIIGIAVPVAVVIILAATSGGGGTTARSANDTSICGCPQVYVEQKGKFDFQNGIFSGAVYANLERMDYLPLGDLQPENSDIRLRISGHENEIQFLNSAQLIGVSHKQDSKIIVDGKGKFYTIHNPEIAGLATTNDNRNISTLLSKADGNAFQFDTYDPKEEYSKAYLTFKKPFEKGNARLLIRAKNSHWAAAINNEYTLLFGKEYIPYRDKWENTNPEKMKAFILKQGLPIKVYVENGEKWEYAGYFSLSGTENYRDMVMEIKVPENKRSSFRIKLESVYRFWDLDYAAIDYSSQEELNSFKIAPSSASNLQGEDQKKQIAERDKMFAVLNNDERIDIGFHVPEKAENKTVSYFLASSGYYHIQKTYPVKANVSGLKEFKKPGEFDRFSREKYQELEQWESLAKHMSPSSN